MKGNIYLLVVEIFPFQTKQIGQKEKLNVNWNMRRKFKLLGNKIYKFLYWLISIKNLPSEIK